MNLEISLLPFGADMFRVYESHWREIIGDVQACVPYSEMVALPRIVVVSIHFYYSFDCGQVTTNSINPNPKTFLPESNQAFEFEALPFQYPLSPCVLRHLSLHLVNTQAYVVITFKTAKQIVCQILFSGSEEKAFFLYQGH